MRVAIVGGSVVGLSASIFLSEQGHDVTVFEHTFEKQHTHCSGLVSGFGVEHIQRLLSLTVPTLKHVRRANVFYKNKLLAQLYSEQGYYLIDRLKFERALITKAEKTGVELSERFMTMQHIRNLIHDYDVIIGADGPLSLTAKVFGFPRFRALSHLYRTHVNEQKKEIEIRVGERKGVFFTWYLPTPHGVEYGIWAKQRVYERGSVGRVMALGPRKQFVKRVNNKAVVLLGDAAGHAKPLTAGGIVTGITSAQLLAEVGWQMFEQRWYETFGTEFFVQGLVREWLWLAKFLPFTVNVSVSAHFNPDKAYESTIHHLFKPLINTYMRGKR
jgi:flavin-dependent dehydrogenase